MDILEGILHTGFVNVVGKAGNFTRFGYRICERFVNICALCVPSHRDPPHCPQENLHRPATKCKFDFWTFMYYQLHKI